MFHQTLRLFHTVRYLKPVQIYGRVFFRLLSPKPDLRPAPEQAKISAIWQVPSEKQQSLLSTLRFRFLGLEQELTTADDWNHPDWDKLWLYNLHYFDDLCAAGAETRKAWHFDLIEKWISENGPGEGNGWEPYPTSLRIINWIKWSLAGNRLSENAVQSLAVQTRFLCKRLEVHLLGNHLFANAKALVFAGLFFAGSEADSWLSKGLEIFAEQIQEQILKDGGHLERSPMYHAIILDDLLDLINVMRTYGRKPPAQWIDKAERMLNWSAGMKHPDGNIVLFNDAAFGIAPRPEQLFEYGDHLGLKVASEINVGLVRFDATGYLRIQHGPALAFLDVAQIGPDYLPGHAHADTLNFELSLFGQRVIVDSGTSCYGTSEERLRQRGTAAHNTVTINGENSSEVWGGFRVAWRARPFDLQIDDQPETKTISCSHNGYRRLAGKPVHRRCWKFDQESLTIVDAIAGSFESAVACYHFHPDCRVAIDENSQIQVELPGGQSLCLKIKGGQGSLVDTTYHPEFGLSLSNKCLEIVFDGSEAKVTFLYE